MKAEEIRFNNYYLDEKGEVIQFTFSMMDVDMFDVWKPIELTPSWLERMGLPKDGSTFGINMDYALCFERIKDKVFLVTSDNQIVLKIDFVHTFQNVYYHLNKGKEIEIKQLEKV